MASEGAPPAKGKQGKSPVFWVATGCCGCLALVLIGVGVFIGIPALMAYRMGSGVAEVPRVMMEALKKGDVDKAYAQLSSSYQARVSREEFAAFVAGHPALQDNRESTFNSRSIQNETATLEDGKLVSSSGITEIATFELQKEGGVWKISDIRFRDSFSSGIPAPPVPRPDAVALQMSRAA